MGVISDLPSVLLPWYEQNKRDLPWRNSSDPYHIWVSEIMLQQTRAEAVRGYYTRFLDHLPDVVSLANAPDELLHKLWEGLGYYSRVRNLKKAAKMIMEQHGGKFPKVYEQVLALPGIGEYTAGAICSIAFNEPTPAVDGNVLRVISRITDDPTNIDLPAYKKHVKNILSDIYPENAGTFTQALMELGATVCGPNKKPDCVNCPCKSFCLGFSNGTAPDLPIRSEKRARKIQYKTVFILSCQDKFALIKRPAQGLLANMWQFPDCSENLSLDTAIKMVEEMGFYPKEIYRQVEKKHVFTHVEWRMFGYYIEVAQIVEGFAWFTAQQIENETALPTAYKQFWDIL